MKGRSAEQKAVRWLAYFVSGAVGLGALLDALWNAVSLSDSRALLLGAVLVVSWLFAEFWVRWRATRWALKGGATVGLRSLGVAPRLALVGALGLLAGSRFPPFWHQQGRPDLLSADSAPRSAEKSTSPAVKGNEIGLLEAPGGRARAYLFSGTEIEIRDRAGPFCEVYAYGYVFDDALSEKRRGTNRVAREAYLWSNPFGWYEEFGVTRQPDNFRLGRLVAESTVDVIEVDDPAVYVRKIRVAGWIPATEIAGGVTYQRRTNGDLREWLSDGKVATRVSDVTRGEGLKVYFQLRNPQGKAISVREVRAELFDSRGGVRARILSLERQDIALVAPEELRLFSLDSDGHPVWPTAIELRVFLDDHSQSGPFVVSWQASQVAGTDRD